MSLHRHFRAGWNPFLKQNLKIKLDSSLRGNDGVET